MSRKEFVRREATRVGAHAAALRWKTETTVKIALCGFGLILVGAFATFLHPVLDVGSTIFFLFLPTSIVYRVRWYRSASSHLHVRVGAGTYPPDDDVKYHAWCEAHGLQPYAAGDETP